jgi:hypothetical protein
MAYRHIVRPGSADLGKASSGNARFLIHRETKQMSLRFQKSSDTKIIESVLAECEVGNTITYESLSRAIGRDVRTHALGALNSARKALLNDKGLVFSVEPNVGCVRLDDSAIVQSTESDRRRMQRTSTRALKKLSVVDFKSLDEATKKLHTTASAQIGAIAMFSQKSTSKKIESKLSGNAATLPIGETLKLFLE